MALRPGTNTRNTPAIRGVVLVSAFTLSSPLIATTRPEGHRCPDRGPGSLGRVLSGCAGAVWREQRKHKHAFTSNNTNQKSKCTLLHWSDLYPTFSLSKYV